MTDLARLERRLNALIDDELAKGEAHADCDTVAACVDALLRMDDERRYAFSEDEYVAALGKALSPAASARRRTKKKIAILIAAAILAVLLALSAIAWGQIRYNIFRFDDHTEFIFPGSKDKITDEFTIGYIPEEFLLTEENISEINISYNYFRSSDSNNLFINVKIPTGTTGINSQEEDEREVEIDGIKYTYYGSNDKTGRTLIWNDEKYIYTIIAELSDDELMKIARSIEKQPG